MALGTPGRADPRAWRTGFHARPCPAARPPSVRSGGDAPRRLTWKIVRRGTSLKGVRLDYPDVRNRIQDGDILLFRGKSWFSRLLRWGTRSPYSHSGILGWWNGRLMVLEAVPSGVMASRLSIVVQQYSGHVE